MDSSPRQAGCRRNLVREVGRCSKALDHGARARVMASRTTQELTTSERGLEEEG